MIRICDKEFDASTVVEVYCDNKIPIQPVESGFDVIDHIKKEPLQVVAEVIIFEEGSTQHGSWGCRMIDGRMVCEESVRVAPNIGTYKYLVELRDKRKIFLLDASDYSREASMIYPDMAIAHLGQFVLRGGVYRCEITFVQITKHVIVTETLHIYDTDGEIRWSKEPIEPTNVETATDVDYLEDLPEVPSPHLLIYRTADEMLGHILDWAGDKARAAAYAISHLY